MNIEQGSTFSGPIPSSSASLATGSPSIGVIVSLHALRPGMRAWGPAFTVNGLSGDNLALHRAIAAARSGDVLVAELAGDVEKGHWGELMSIAGQAAGLAGLIINGAIRDSREIAALGFPTFHRGTHPSPAAKTYPGSLQVQIVIDGVVIMPGDGVFADDDGIVVVRKDDLDAAVQAAGRVDEYELSVADRLSSGEGTVHVLGIAVPISIPNP